MQEQLKNITFTLVRVTTGIIYAAHGWQKLTAVQTWQNQLADMGVAAPNVLAYLAIAGEFLGGVGLIVGLLTPIAAFGTASTSAAAIVIVHWGHGLFAANNGFEFPLTLLVISLLFMTHGGGAYSLDAALLRARRTRRTRREERATPRHEPAPGAWQEGSHLGSERQYR